MYPTGSLKKSYLRLGICSSFISAYAHEYQIFGHVVSDKLIEVVLWFYMLQNLFLGTGSYLKQRF